MPKTFNFSNPMQSRKWLRILHDDPVSGLRITPNLDLSPRVLGFSFRSNSLGLRGPVNVHAPNVILGTSYAMGFCVDNGQNWYEKYLDESAWLNLGMPIGVRELKSLFESIYLGPAQTILVVYHPNYWVQTHLFEICRSRGNSVFEGMGWQTAFWPTLRIAFRRLRQRRVAIREGRFLVFRHRDVTYQMDALYSRFDFDANPAIVSLTLDTLQEILGKFQRVIFVRTLLKQDMVPEQYQNDILRTTLANHHFGWELVQERLGGNKHIEFSIAPGFVLEDFLPRDTHWTNGGNEKFARFIQGLLH